MFIAVLKRPLYPFLFAAYSIISLYARNPGEVRPREVIRPLLFALIATALLMWLLRRVLKDKTRADFVAMLIIFFFSSSHLVFRMIEGYFPHLPGYILLWSVITVELLSILAASSNLLWRRYATVKVRITLSKYLNVISIIFIMFPLLLLANFWIRAWDDSPHPWQTYLPREPLPQKAPASAPNIYYIILDGYGRQDILQDYYEFDNSAFISFLEDKGFFVATNSQSNYTQTTLSLASSLNMNFLDFTQDLIERNSINRLPLFDMIENNRFRKILETMGYRFVVIDSGYSFTEFSDDTLFISPYPIFLTDLERWYYSTTALNAIYESGFGRFLQTILPLAGYDTHRQFIVSGFDALENLGTTSIPTFVFAHIVAPHPPFVINRDGKAITPDRPYLTGDGFGFTATRDEYKKGYIDQLEYVNNRTEKFINKILSADPNAIIILQGDHGPGLLLNRESLNESCLRERASILNAYYFPHDQAKSLNSSISPVNTFRVVLNTYFDAELPLLPNRTYFATQSHPYEFTDIADQVNAPCLP